MVQAEKVLHEATNMKEMELLDMNLSRLRTVAEEAEEVQSHWHPTIIFVNVGISCLGVCVAI